MTERLTKSLVDRIQLTDRDQWFWDSEVKGFGLKVSKAGVRTYAFQYRFPSGRSGKTYRITIGKHGSPWTVESARTEARTLSARVTQGENPRLETQRAKAIPTVAELCDTYMAHGTGTKKASTLATDRGRIKRHIKPLLGHLKVTEVTPAIIKKFQNDIASGATKADISTKLRGRAIVKGGKGTAARTLGLLGGIFSYAIELELIDRNPAHGVKRFPDKKNERFLSSEEFTLIGRMLDQAAESGVSQKAIDIILLLILTGARRGEIQQLKWSEVDLVRGMLMLDDSKTGQKKIRLNSPASTILEAQAARVETRTGYVFSDRTGSGPFSATSKIWAKIRADTPLADVRLHDLRHSFASVAIAQGASLPVIGKLLGHANISTTQRYAHLTDDPISSANEAVGTMIAAQLSESNKEP